MSKTIYSSEQEYLIKQLVKAREEMGLKQQEVAKKLGKTQSYVSKVESGQILIDVIQLNELSKIYKKKLEFFIKQ